MRSFKRTVDTDNPKFEDEHPKPVLGNLATHTREKHAEALKAGAIEKEETATVDRGYTLKSAKVMEAYLERGALNPALAPTQKGFNQLFAAWILEDDLPFTQGESWSLSNLFKYLKCKFVLPKDSFNLDLKSPEQ